MTTLEEFVTAACAELSLPPQAARTELVLGLAREVAHHAVRPGAPVSAYLLGVAVGQGGDPDELAQRLITLAQRLAESNG